MLYYSRLKYPSPLYTNDFYKTVQKNKNAVILLEGTRSLHPGDYSKLVDLGKHVAQSLNECIFRSGNAAGSDEAFINGVDAMSGKIELVVPYASHRSLYKPRHAITLSLEELENEELYEIEQIALKANPDRAKLINFYTPGSKNILSIKASYLLRDVLKLTGLPSKNFKPASIGIFHINLQNVTGGTFHTMKVCKYLGIPQFESINFFNC